MHRCCWILTIFHLLVRGQFYGGIVRETRALSSTSFDEITIHGSFDIFLSQSKPGESSPTVEVETALDSQKFVIVDIIDQHVLSIYINGSVKTDKNIYLYVRFPAPLHRLTMTGIGNTMTDDAGIHNPGSEKFTFHHHGSATVALRLNVTDFEFYCSGNGNSRLSGEVREQASFFTEGINDIQALQLSAKRATISGIGFNLLRINAIADLEVDVNGTYHVYYRLPYGIEASKLIGKGIGHISRII